MSFVFDLDEFLSEMEDGKDKVLGEMMSQPVEWCSRPGYKLNLADRSYKDWRFRCKCKDPEVCPSCARQYAIDKFNILYATMIANLADKVVVIDGDENDCRRLRNKHGYEKIIRVPNENGITLLCVIEPQEGDVVMGLDDFTGDYISELFRTPPGTRVTGGVKIEVEEEVEERETIEIETTVFVVDAEPEVLASVHYETIKRTYHLDPTKETLQDAVDEHETVFSKILTERGIEFKKIAARQSTTVVIEDINWKRRRRE